MGFPRHGSRHRGSVDPAIGHRPSAPRVADAAGRRTRPRVLVDLLERGQAPHGLAELSANELASEALDALLELGIGLTQAVDALERVDDRGVVPSAEERADVG